MKTILILLLLCQTALAAQGSWPVPGGKVYVAAVTNGEIGNKSGANSDPDTFTSGQGEYISATTVTAGTVSYIHFAYSYLYGTPKQVNAGIYSSDGSTKLAEGNLTTISGSAGTAHVQLDTPFTLVAATTYRLVVVHASSDTIAVYTTNMSYHPTSRDTSFTAGNTLDTTISGGTSQQYYGLRVWATNTADGS